MLSRPELVGYSFHHAGRLMINQMPVQDYVARKDGESVDRFHVFFAAGVWNAWIADTVSEATIRRRRAFAAALTGDEQAAPFPPAAMQPD